MEFEDLLPIMAERLGESEFMTEICKGFRLLADPGSGLITFDSLKRNASVLGLGLDSMSDSDLQDMLKQGDLDGDGALSEHEFCVLMVRLSPCFMQNADNWIHWAVSAYLDDDDDDDDTNDLDLDPPLPSL